MQDIDAGMIALPATAAEKDKTTIRLIKSAKITLSTMSLLNLLFHYFEQLS